VIAILVTLVVIALGVWALSAGGWLIDRAFTWLNQHIHPTD
jgi:hypothetical protein